MYNLHNNIEGPKICIFSGESSQRQKIWNVEDWISYLRKSFHVLVNKQDSADQSNIELFKINKLERNLYYFDLFDENQQLDLAIGYGCHFFSDIKILKTIKSRNIPTCIIPTSVNVPKYELDAISSGLIDYALIFDYLINTEIKDQILNENLFQVIVDSKDCYNLDINFSEKREILFVTSGDVRNSTKEKIFIKNLQHELKKELDILSVNDFVSKLLNKSEIADYKNYIFYINEDFSANTIRLADFLLNMNKKVILSDFANKITNKFNTFSSIENACNLINNFDIIKAKDSTISSIELNILRMMQRR